MICGESLCFFFPDKNKMSVCPAWADLRLTETQTKPAKLLLNGYRGVLCAMGLGTGKTLTAVHAVDMLYRAKKITTALVVTKKSLRLDYLKACERCMGHVPKYYRDGSRVITYDRLRIHPDHYPVNKQTCMVVDEAQTYANFTKTYHAAMAKAEQAGYVILLSATPFMNRATDLCPLINLISRKPGFTKARAKNWAAELAPTLLPELQRHDTVQVIVAEKDRYVGLKGRITQVHDLDVGRVYQIDRFIDRNGNTANVRGLGFKRNALQLLSRKNAPFPVPAFVNDPYSYTSDEAKGYGNWPYNKRLKAAVVYDYTFNDTDFPRRVDHEIAVELSQLQYESVKAIEQQIDKMIRQWLELQKGFDANGEPKGMPSAVNSFMNKSRRLMNTPILQGYDQTDFEMTPKTRAIVSKIRKGPKPVVIYSSWLDAGIKHVQPYVVKMGYRTGEVTGKNSPTERAAAVLAYNQGNIDVLFISDAGGEGLTLLRTRQFHVMDSQWNNSKLEQAIGRAIRRNSHVDLPPSERQVDVYHWISVIPRRNRSDPDAPLFTADQRLRQICAIKKRTIDMLMKMLESTSVQHVHSPVYDELMAGTERQRPELIDLTEDDDSPSETPFATTPPVPSTVAVTCEKSNQLYEFMVRLQERSRDMDPAYFQRVVLAYLARLNQTT